LLGEDVRVRKNVKDLSAQEKKEFVDAILKLKSVPPPPGLERITLQSHDSEDVVLEIPSYYDMFVAFHQSAVLNSHGGPVGRDAAHRNAVFLPWHRKLLWMYENALREVSGKDITLPYWDWTDEASTAAVFSDDLMGPSGDPNCQPDCPYAVVEGPFSKGKWQVNLPTRMEQYTTQYPKEWTWLVRAQGRYEFGYPVNLPKAEEVQAAMSIDAYDSAPYDWRVDRTKSFRNYVEGFDGSKDGDSPGPNQHMHNIGHDWVAGRWTTTDAQGNVVGRVGTMEPLDISPSDPVFFLHHCNVDRVWAQWQQYKDGRMNAYIPEGIVDTWGPHDKMFPFSMFEGQPFVGNDITPADMLNFEDLQYTYDSLGE
jgi:tyrosinase